MRNLTKLIMVLSLLIGASSSLNAQYNVQDLVMSGIDVSDAIAQCDAGDAELCHEVGAYYLFQSVENPSLYSATINYFAKACVLGHSNGCHSSGGYLTLDTELAAFIGFQPDFDRGIKLLEKGCAINDSLSPVMCADLAKFYFEGRYDSINLEQAYQYAMSECDDNDYESCFVLYRAYDRIAHMPNVPIKEVFLIKGASAKMVSEFWFPTPPEMRI